MLKKIWNISLSIGVVLACAVTVVSAMNMGAAEMNMPGGIQGDVWFPHQQHQKMLGDCIQCHDLFPQEAGSIEQKKAEGELKKKTGDEQKVHCLPSKI